MSERLDVYTLLFLLKRRDGMTREEFIDYYEKRHAPLAASYMPGVRKYVRRYLAPARHRPPVDELEFDVITEIWCDDPAQLRNFGDPDVAATIARDEEALFDRAAMRVVVVEEHETPLA
jgi:uncharacterized protein (TIGR02118 family)